VASDKVPSSASELRKRETVTIGGRADPRRTIRFFKQVLGWDAPLLRDPAAADRWTWLIIAAYTQLRLAAALAADLRLPWQRPQPPGTMTPLGSAADSAPSARHSALPQPRRNPAGPAPDARKDPRTPARHPATTSASATLNARNEQNAKPRRNRQVKRQAIQLSLIRSWAWSDDDREAAHGIRR
jgi:hypothetical protein